MSEEPPFTGERLELQRAFHGEMDRLAGAASRASLVEGVMRLRALGEIAASLDTSELLALAVRIEASSIAKTSRAG